MRVELTQDQLAAMDSITSKMMAASKDNAPGMMMAQIYPRDGAMVVGFIGHEKSMRIQAAIDTISIGSSSSCIADRQGGDDIAAEV